jgi:hypothetical protein
VGAVWIGADVRGRKAFFSEEKNQKTFINWQEMSFCDLDVCGEEVGEGS